MVVNLKVIIVLTVIFVVIAINVHNLKNGLVVAFGFGVVSNGL